MKNIKKLLATMAAVGFTTVAAVNVAASNPKPAEGTNDLTKSFNALYNTNAITVGEWRNWGLSFAGSETIFTFSNINVDTITDLVKPNPNAIVTLVTKESDPIKFQKATKVGQELAQITQNTNDGVIKRVGDKHTFIINFTLKLWKDNGTGEKTGTWVQQDAKMDIAVKLITLTDAKKLSEVTAIDALKKLNVATKNLSLVKPEELLASADFKQAILDAVKKIAKKTEATEYGITLASDAKGTTLTNLNLSETGAKVFVKLIAINEAKHIQPNTHTNWIAVSLPVANDLHQINSDTFNSLAKTDFTITDVYEIPRTEILAGLVKNAKVLKALQNINADITDFANSEYLNWKIATNATGKDIGTTKLDASHDYGMYLYITLTPGSLKYVTGIAQDKENYGLEIHIPQLANK